MNLFRGQSLAAVFFSGRPITASLAPMFSSHRQYSYHMRQLGFYDEIPCETAYFALRNFTFKSAKLHFFGCGTVVSSMRKVILEGFQASQVIFSYF